MGSIRKAIPSGRLALWAALALAVTSASAAAQKPGGILKLPHGDSPASMSIHEESTIASEGPMMAVFNNLVMFDQHISQNRLDTVVPDLAAEWSWSEDGTTLTFKLRQDVKARRQAVYGQGRQMHLGSAAGQGDRKAQDRSAQILVPEPCGGDDRRRFRGQLPSEAAAAVVHRAAGVGLVAGLPVPRDATRDAAASDRHGPFQIRRIQAE
jgi:hypothetical protein